MRTTPRAALILCSLITISSMANAQEIELAWQTRDDLRRRLRLRDRILLDQTPACSILFVCICVICADRTSGLHEVPDGP